ncbi:cobalt/nickel transport system permease protein [Keratinibaculum paraultunense]|uniref:Cobalt/nickel transport system permease protein n=1 Tax=Keratinibaculum paraultunense TaxID=1278232 RepID=A0A4R3KXX3_9FIRM|nr:cobalt ECF transporter T component CbiQ [Keratinibaculum paraultunense]QQY78957.1 cobalt ECF transporter T component CbiQ [Keratinibaculum paraultunense]TCS90575.1 cobalt/nickel transport system permease protein [Keratinibaculum paraultunense]
MLLIDKYAYTNRLKDFNPMAKMIFAIGALILAITIDNSYVNLMVFLLMICLTIFVAKIPINRYFKILIVPIIFLTISGITILLSISNEDVFIWSIKISNKYLGFTYKSLIEFFKLTIRVLASISSTLFLTLTTPLNHMIGVFKKLKMPNIVIELLVLIYRSIFIFLEESKDIIMAQELRFGYTSIKNTYRSISLLIKSLLIALLIRFQDMQISLETRLYRGEFKTGD